MAIMMLISIGLAVVPTAEAICPGYTVKGTLYLNDDVIAPDGIEIRLVFDEGTNTTLTYEYNSMGDHTNYNLGFMSVNGHANDKTGTFVVEYNGLEYTPIDNQTIFIDKGVCDYYMDLRIDASEPTNNPPNIPSSPSPSDGAPAVDTGASLSWTGGDPDVGDTVTYDVYFGTTNPPPIVSTDQAGTTYAPSLSYSTPYYWQIIAEDNHGATTDGPIWSFTTKDKPSDPPGDPDPPNNPPPPSLPPEEDEEELVFNNPPTRPTVDGMKLINGTLQAYTVCG